MRDGYTASELAAMGLPGLSSAANKVRARARREGWASFERPARGFRGTETVYSLDGLPTSLRASIAERVAAESSVEAPALVEGPHAEIAIERFRVVVAVVELVARGETISAAIEAVRGEQHSARTVRRWHDTVRGLPRREWTQALMPSWKGTREPDACHEEAWAFFRDNYLRASQPSVAECYRQTLDVAADNGWSPVPSEAAMRRRLEREVSPTTKVLKRQGPDALERFYPAQERDRSGMRAMDALNSDGHVFDVRVRWPDNIIERPTIVAFQDIATGYITSWRIDRTENADLIRLAFADTATRWGCPRQVYFDNGLAFASKGNTGGCHWRFRGRVKPEEAEGVITQLVERVNWVLPHHGQSKPIERAWRDLCESISRHALCEGAYVGSNPQKRPHNYDNAAAVDLEVFMRLVARQIEKHNERTGRRGSAVQGKSLKAAFEESYATIERRPLSPAQERLLWLAHENVRVRSGAEIHLMRSRYWTDALMRHVGKNVVVRFDPDALAKGLHVYLPDGTYVGLAEAQGKVAFADRQAARDHGRKRAEFKRVARELADLETEHSHAEIAALHLKALGIPTAPAAGESNVIRPNFGAPKLDKAGAIMTHDASAREKREASDRDEVAALLAEISPFDSLCSGDE